MRARREVGFSLIEVLVALFVLALGVVGAAGLQLGALRMRHQSALMSHAVHAACALAERIRANAGQLREATSAYLELTYDGQTEGMPTRPSPMCSDPGAHCDSAQLARFDVYEFKQQLHQHFPGARAVVCRDARLWDGARHALSWDCGGPSSAPLVIKLGWRVTLPNRGTDPTDAQQFAPSVAIMLAEDAL